MTDAAALVVAAGRGTRFGGDLPKVFVDLAGSPLFLWALRAYDRSEAVSRLLLAVSADYLDLARDLCEQADLAKPLTLLAGGARRQDTVWAGLEALADSPPEVLAIHDGARPLIDEETIRASILLAQASGACVAAAQVTDTVKVVSPEGLILDTPDRTTLWRAQTPQTFRYQLLVDCYRQARQEDWEVTDDASVVERCGRPVFICPSRPTNLKVTTGDDLHLAETLLSRRGQAPTPAMPDQTALSQAPSPEVAMPTERPEAFSLRVGHGYDVHALVEGRKLILGGVDLPHPTGLAGHSDADVLLHAVCDALLGAAAAGDIGKLFPDTDPAYKGIDSALLCRRVADHIRSLGFEIVNVDATVQAQRPKLAPHIPQMRENLARALQVEVSQVSVKATTTERLGFVGREEGIAAEAVCLLSLR